MSVPISAAFFGGDQDWSYEGRTTTLHSMFGAPCREIECHLLHRHLWIAAADWTPPIDPFKQHPTRHSITARSAITSMVPKIRSVPFESLISRVPDRGRKCHPSPPRQIDLSQPSLLQAACPHCSRAAFAIRLSPVEHLIRVDVVSSRHSRYRGFRQERLFHDLSSHPDRSAPLLCSLDSDVKCLV